MKKNGVSASLTVEASLILPVFLFAMIITAYLGKLASCQDDVQQAITRIAREASAEYGASKATVLKSSVYYQTKFASYMKGMGLSVSFAQSRLMRENDEIDLIVTYRMKIPFFFPALSQFSMRQRVHTRAFTGVERRGQESASPNRMVYVTETGRVYHDNLLCPYLKLSISQILYGDLAAERNESGGKYKRCERCCRRKNIESSTMIYITNYGDRYHSSISCSGLKRNIRQISITEAGSRTACSKCVSK